MKSFLAACLLALSSPAGAIPYVDYTDLWWNPNESGWGVTLTQSGTFLFATFFVYGPSGQPTWVTGDLSQDTSGNFTGTVYANTGPYFGGVFNAALVSATAVGTATFAPTAADTGVLVYIVNGVTVTKAIQRQTLTTITIGGNYKGAFLDQVTGCGNSSQNGDTTLFGNMVVTQTTDGRVQLTVQILQSNGSNGAQCNIVGASVQRGQIFSIPSAAYTCSNGLATTAVVSGLKATTQGIEGTYSAPTSGSCQETVSFSALVF